MRRFQIVFVLTITVFITRPSNAAHTAAEIHIFFGNAITNPTVMPNGSSLPSPTEIGTNPAVMLQQSDTAVLPIWCRVLGTAQGADANINFFSIGFRIYGEGDTTAFINSGNSSEEVFIPHTQFIPATKGDGSGHPLFPELKEFRGGYWTLVSAGSQSLIPGTTAFLGWMAVAVNAGATNGQSMKLFFSNGYNAAATITGQTGVNTHNTIAFGAVDELGVGGMPGSPLNSFRRGNTNQDILTTFQVSSVADATVTVVPEPSTVCLIFATSLMLFRRTRA